MADPNRAPVAAVCAADAYLAGDPAFSGDRERLVAAIEHNLTSDAEPVDPSKHIDLTQKALGRLSPDCRGLLRLAGVDGVRPEDARLRLGSRSTSTVFYRRAVCLRRVKAYLVERLQGLDAGLRCLDPELGGNLWRLKDPATDASLCRRFEHHLAACPSCRQQQGVETTVMAGLSDGSLRLGPAIRSRVRAFRALAIGGAGALAAGLVLVAVLPSGALPPRIIGIMGAVAMVAGGYLVRRCSGLESAFDKAL